VQPLIEESQALLGKIGNNVDRNIEDISRETMALLSRLNTISKNMEANVSKVSNGAVNLLAGLESNSQQLTNFMNDDNAKRISSTLENADMMMRNLNKTVNDMSEAGKLLTHLLSESTSLVQENKQDIRISVQETRETLQTISSNIDSIVFQLDNTARNMSEFSRRIKESPSSLIQSRPLKDNAE
jgi:predicted  nucleic acid-binding Zn-ribbon protein